MKDISLEYLSKRNLKLVKTNEVINNLDEIPNKVFSDIFPSYRWISIGPTSGKYSFYLFNSIQDRNVIRIVKSKNSFSIDFGFLKKMNEEGFIEELYLEEHEKKEYILSLITNTMGEIRNE